MVLTVDIGNSNIVAGGLAPEKTYFVERLSTNLYKTSLEYAVSFKHILELNQIDAGSISGSIICSVVPPSPIRSGRRWNGLPGPCRWWWVPASKPA